MKVNLTQGPVPLDAYLALPPEPRQAPGIVVLQEVFGVNAYIRGVCDSLAAAGFIALAPALFQRTAPGLELGYGPEDLSVGRSHKDQTTASQLLEDVRGAMAYLAENYGVQKFGCVGFCFGGHVAFLAATLPEMSASASFYGAGVATTTPGGGSPSLTRAQEIRGRLALFFGAQDPLIPSEQVEQIESHLKKTGTDFEIWRYPKAGHGFLCDQRNDFEPESAADAWKRLLAFLAPLKAHP